MTKQIRLALVGFSYNHPTGIRNIKTLEELSRLQGIHIDLITGSHWEGYNEKRLKKSENSNLKIHYLEPVYLSKISLQFRYYMKGLFRKLKELDPDIIYICNEPLAINTFLATICSKILKKKIMCLTWEILDLHKIFPIRIYERFVLRNMSHIFVGSTDAVSVLVKKNYAKSKVTVLQQTGVDLKFFRKQDRNLCKRLKIQKDKTCLFVGRLEDEKGIRNILAAKRLLESKGKRYTYLFVGDGKWYRELSRLSKEDTAIKLMRWVEYDKLPTIYNSANIFLYPSIPKKFWEEQFGYSIIEAMACGVPVIASNMSGPREIIRNDEDGILIESDNPDALAQKIELLMENRKKRNSMSEKAIQNIKRYDHANMARRLLYEIRKQVCS